MYPDFNVCPRCGQRMVVAMRSCGRCGQSMPDPPGLAIPRLQHRQTVGALALLVILLAVSLFAILLRYGSTPAFVGTWYAEDGRAVTFEQNGIYRDPMRSFATTDGYRGNRPKRSWLASGQAIQIIDGDNPPITYLWSLNLDGRSLNITEAGRSYMLTKSPPRQTGIQPAGLGGGMEP